MMPANKSGVRKVLRTKVFLDTLVRYSRLMINQVLFIENKLVGKRKSEGHYNDASNLRAVGVPSTILMKMSLREGRISLKD